MKEYQYLLNELLNNGNEKDDRTGTGTLSKFGHQLRFNLADGFPLVTTKKIHLKSVIHELLWFLKGDTNVKYLNDNGVTIWNEWSNENGELGPVYGHQFRFYGKKPDRIQQKKPKLRDGIKAVYLGVGNGSGSTKSPLGKTWEGMMARCYDKKSSSYKTYGNIGVYVCNDWLEFNKFESDVKKIKGWDEKVNNPDKRYVLDKDLIGYGFEYSLNKCTWITDKQNIRLNEDFIYTVEKNGIKYSFTNISDFCLDHKIESKNFSDLWTGSKKATIRNGFKFVKKEIKNNGIDQITNAIEQIKNNPNDRGIIVSAWNVADLDKMALRPCHALFQFYVADGKLSCQLYQRSCDTFLGLPFNIASYALLTHMVAQQCDLEVGDFVWTGGDVHLYKNHIDQAKLQLTREPYQLPKLLINRKPESIFDYKYEDFEIINYQSHPHIAGKVSV
jgi:thymidylate synthase